MSRKIRKCRTDKFDSETNGSFDTCNTCKRLVPSRLYEIHVSNLPFVSRIEFIPSTLLNFSAHVSGVTVDDRMEAIRQSPGAFSSIGMFCI